MNRGLWYVSMDAFVAIIVMASTQLAVVFLVNHILYRHHVKCGVKEFEEACKRIHDSRLSE